MMTPEARIYYAVQEMVWAGKTSKEIRDAVVEAWREVMRQEQEDGEKTLRGVRL